MSSEFLPANFSIPVWLDSLGLDQYTTLFWENAITPDLLFTLTDADLQECGIKTLGHRKRILLAIETLRQNGPQPVKAFPGLAVQGEEIPAPKASKPGFQSLQPLLPKAPIPSTPVESKSRPQQPTAQAGELQSDSIFTFPPANAPSVASDAASTPGVPVRKPFFLDRFGGRFLYISIAVHVLFALGAVVYVVQRIETKRKLTFQAGNKSPNPSTRALEHKVQMTKKKNAMSAPALVKRITTNAVSAKVAITAMDMPVTSQVAPSRLSGMGGQGFSVGMAQMGAPGGGGGGGGAMPFFGLREVTPGTLAGTFYDLKQTPGRKPTGMNGDRYAEEIRAFAQGNWNPNHFSRFYKGPHALYTSQVCIPNMPAANGPAAFNLERAVQPTMWVAIYKGTVSPLESGTYHFVGGGDDVLMVRFKGELALERNLGIPIPNYKSTGAYQYKWPAPDSPPFQKGPPLILQAGNFYPIELIFGERPGGGLHAVVLIEKVGGKYEKDPAGNPILPLFRIANMNIPKLEDGMSLPPIAPNGPVWNSRSSNSLGSGLDFFRNKPGQ